MNFVNIRLSNPNNPSKTCVYKATVKYMPNFGLELPTNIINELQLEKEDTSSEMNASELYGELFYGYVNINFNGETKSYPVHTDENFDEVAIGKDCLESLIGIFREFNITDLIISTIGVIVGAGWTSIGIKAIFGSQQTHLTDHTPVPGWELGSAIFEGASNLMPIIIGFMGVYIFFWSADYLIKTLRAFKDYKRIWNATLPKLSTKIIE